MPGSLSVLVKPVSGACNLNCSYCFYGEEAAERAEKRLPPMALVRKSVYSLLERKDSLLRSTFLYSGGRFEREDHIVRFVVRPQDNEVISVRQMQFFS